VLFLFVIGGLFFGIFTPTEAGAAGVFGALLIGVVSRRLKWDNFKSSLMEGGQTAVMVLFMIVGTLVFIRLLALSGVSSAFINFILGLEVHRLVILLGILFIFFVLGMFVTAVSMQVLVLPLAFPVITALGYDPIWFCILTIKMCEIGIVTPPVGLNCYIVNNTSPEIGLKNVFKGVIPFLMMDFTTVAILIAVPQIITFLPNLMYAPKL
jgi:tripartite ATP-independent transporter DctM subunit